MNVFGNINSRERPKELKIVNLYNIFKTKDYSLSPKER